LSEPMSRFICISQRRHLIYLNNFYLKPHTSAPHDYTQVPCTSNSEHPDPIFSALFFAAFAAMSAKNAGQGELTQFVSDHFFGNEHLVEDPTIMDEKRMPYKLRDNGASPCPSFDRLFFADGFQFLDLSVQFRDNERTFFD